METNSTTPIPCPVTVRRNPPRRARATPSSTVPLPMTSSTPSASISREIPSFPIEDILSMKIPLQNPNPDLLTTQSSSSQEPLCENLKVFLRIRPLTTQQSSVKNRVLTSRSKNVWPQNPSTKNAPKAKSKKKSEICLKVNDSHSVTLSPPQSLQDLKRIKSEVYEGFSHVFSADSSQEEVYKQIVDPLVEDFMKGKSGMFAALGPSGSGKTHTVFGSQREPGMVPLALRQIFSKTESSSRTFYVSMFEIYAERGKAERIFDLSRHGGDPCMQQSTIKGLKEAVVCDAHQAESLISLGMTKRTTAMTNSNNQSSRSQCIINIRSGPANIDGEVDDQSHSALLTIVDLAGAEREKRTGNQGTRLLESNFINNTSMVFGLCLRSLLEHQKNPKKPLQKHFQSSLLTKYLRDYLEGKKRMTLILTVKSGEEDYLDASFLLRQASPYMKIKFDSVEEPLNVISNKRQFQTLPRAEHLKRMKLSSFEACAAIEGNGEEDYQLPKAEVPLDQVKEVKHAIVLVHSAATTSSELNENASAYENVAELAKRDRENQIMQGFAKALWNVLKQYKNKLEVAENEIQCLRDSLTSEKARSSELEHELNNFKSCNSRGKEVSEEKSLLEVVEESRDDEFSESKGYQSTNVHEHGDKPHGNVQNAGDVKDMKDLGRDATSLNGEPTGSGLLESPVRSSHLLIIDTDNVSSSIKGNLLQNEEEVQSCAVITDLCLGVEHLEEQIYQKGDGSPQSVHHAEDLQEIEDIETEDISSKGKPQGTGLSESVVSSSKSLVISRDDCSSSVEGNHLQSQKLDEPDMPKTDVTSAIVCGLNREPEFDPELVSCSKPLNPPKPKRRLLPASSVLLRNISSLDFEDENENVNRKGNRGEKKVSVDVTKRSQGSISLIRLLTDNLHL